MTDGPEQGITATLSQWSVETTFDTLPEAVVAAVKRSIVDSVGVMAAGSDHHAIDTLAAFVRDNYGEPPAPGHLVVGRPFRAEVLNATLLNGTMAERGCASDASILPTRCHISAPLLSALLALSERTDASGPDVITAFAVGFEVVTRCADAVYSGNKGWHGTGVMGPLRKIAAATGRLLGLDATQTAHALALGANNRRACAVRSDRRPSPGTSAGRAPTGCTPHCWRVTDSLAGQRFSTAPAVFSTYFPTHPTTKCSPTVSARGGRSTQRIQAIPVRVRGTRRDRGRATSAQRAPCRTRHHHRDQAQRRARDDETHGQPAPEHGSGGQVQRLPRRRGCLPRRLRLHRHVQRRSGAGRALPVAGSTGGGQPGGHVPPRRSRRSRSTAAPEPTPCTSPMPLARRPTR